MCPRVVSTVTALLLFAGAAYAADAPASPQGGVLADTSGRTLYIYDKDTTLGRSACNGTCAALWPPYAADNGAQPAGNFSIATRDDGSRQWAYKGKPLYRWAGDQKPGDTTGDGVNDIWHVIK